MPIKISPQAQAVRNSWFPTRPGQAGPAPSVFQRTKEELDVEAGEGHGQLDKDKYPTLAAALANKPRLSRRIAAGARGISPATIEKRAAVSTSLRSSSRSRSRSTGLYQPGTPTERKRITTPRGGV